MRHILACLFFLLLPLALQAQAGASDSACTRPDVPQQERPPSRASTPPVRIFSSDGVPLEGVPVELAKEFSTNPLPNVADFRGQWVVTLVREDGAPGDSRRVRGQLHLNQVGSANRKVLLGEHEIPADSVGAVGLLALPHALSSKAYLSWYPNARTLSIVLGPGGENPGWRDVGVVLNATSLGVAEIRGTWTDGAATRPAAHGFFCARRTSAAAEERPRGRAVPGRRQRLER